ncbi:MAG: phosphatase PAP2 family protein [Treponema sp.]|jgi:membrane-associated phospholipid phosphatase|nr:phosphatase PAP2 family protein [Treponema sp.]
MKKNIFVFSLVFFCCLYLYGQTDDAENNAAAPIQLKLVFYHFGYNTLHSVTYNYGLNFVGAGLVTPCFIESGFDLYWRNIGYNNSSLSNAALLFLYTGFTIPAITPLIFYGAGKNKNNEKLQITALALTQSLFITLMLQSPMKMVTGRAGPGIVDNPTHTRGLPEDDHSKTFNWFNMDFINGWPSGHTANAFSAAATIATIYKENIWLKIGVYSYAALTGLGVSLNVHWASEVFAGALIGYAIGKTVGKSFRQLLDNTTNENNVSFYFTPKTIGVIVHL